MANVGPNVMTATSVAAAAMLLTACANEGAAGDIKYAVSQCVRVSIVDQASGALLKGAEDMALDAENARLYLSAYDRRAVEKAAQRKTVSIPEGGLYVVSLVTLLDAQESVVNARAIVDAGEVAGGLRPHGLTFDPAAGEIVFINRGYQRVHGKWRMTPRIERVGVNGEVFMGGRDRAPCAANDIIEDHGKTLISFDHSACDWRGAFEEAFALARSGVAAGDGETLFNRARYANGLTRTIAGDIALADTRAGAILIISEESGGLTLRSEIKTPGGPDNLSITEDGGVIAALHPSLIKIGVHRRLGLGPAPSRVVKVDPDSGALQILFDDPSGELFSAATVAIEWDGALIIGSATDEGLLVCKEAG